ncbi:conserved phage C-terminal domain-containing protein [Niallia sp. XMNu-256]|uniref:conserved phage C-terminal domain-containing protein n=1 Tax=Niallia sp. XMNu-256 TaxID=3082444 RepID=UPI0030CE40AD
MSKLLIQENPMVILPSLAEKIGLNQAIVIQQFHYWLQSSKHTIDGRKWIYNSYKKWESQFTFWSGRTIERAIRSLEEQGLLLSANHNRSKQDKTKWYSINYEKLEELEQGFDGNLSPSTNQKDEPEESNGIAAIDNLVDATTQIDEPGDTDCVIETANMDASIRQTDERHPTKCVTASVNLYQPLPEITTETISEINSKTNSERKKSSLPFAEIITCLNNQTNSRYKVNSRKTKELIQARFNEGFQMDDFKRVIEIKTEEWRNDPVWCKYLRPETLFGTKFESYLNQKNGKKTYREEDFNLDD